MSIFRHGARTLDDMLRTVVVPLLPNIEMFELGVACEVFGSNPSADGLPSYDFALVAGSTDPVTTKYGHSIDVPFDLDRLDDADLIIVPPGGTAAGSLTDPEFARSSTDLAVLEPLFEKLRAAVDRGTPVASLCTGTFVLAAAGILDGRRCTTHWRYANRLAAMYPTAQVDRDVLYIDDDPVLTSAGTAASVDLCLHIVRNAQGSHVANTIARGMVVPPHRDGGQAQYVTTPLPECTDDSIAPLLDWVTENLHRELSVSVLAEQAHMSMRTFARRFTQETGTTPARWIRDQRVLVAQQLLENTDLPIDVVADRVGFGTASVLRQHFLRLRRTTPHAYRRTFHSAESAPVE